MMNFEFKMMDCVFKMMQILAGISTCIASDSAAL